MRNEFHRQIFFDTKNSNVYLGRLIGAGADTNRKSGAFLTLFNALYSDICLTCTHDL